MLWSENTEQMNTNNNTWRKRISEKIKSLHPSDHSCGNMFIVVLALVIASTVVFFVYLVPLVKKEKARPLTPQDCIVFDVTTISFNCGTRTCYNGVVTCTGTLVQDSKVVHVNMTVSVVCGDYKCISEFKATYRNGTIVPVEDMLPNGSLGMVVTFGILSAISNPLMVLFMIYIGRKIKRDTWGNDNEDYDI
jgi:3-hydroxymyristoyl/3-hydroxydecanoyl-(acyl carrier protein) dehydratase